MPPVGSVLTAWVFATRIDHDLDTSRFDEDRSLPRRLTRPAVHRFAAELPIRQ